MKIEEKSDKYFKKLPRDISRRIQMDEEAAYSVTEMDLADPSAYSVTEMDLADPKTHERESKKKRVGISKRA